MNSPVKRVETETVITHVYHRAEITRTNTPVHRPRTAVPQGNRSFQDLGPAPGKRHRHTRMDIWCGKAQNFRKPNKESPDFDPLDRRD